MLKTLDKQLINIKAYNDIADFVYSNMQKNDNTFIYGYLTDNAIVIRHLKKL